jgi:hypothetical protein
MDQESPLSLTSTERRAASFLVVGGGLEGVVKQLTRLQFPKARHSLFHSAALRRLIDEEFSHVIYSTEETDLPANLFTERAFRLKHRPVLMAASYEPEPNNVCAMLLAGARAFVALPLESEMLDLVIGEATNGQPVQPAILRSPRRNEILLRTLLDNLDEIAWNIQASKRYGMEVSPTEPLVDKLRLSASTLRLFCNGGSDGFVRTLVDICETLAPRSNARLTRLRKQLSNQRRKSTQEEETL